MGKSLAGQKEAEASRFHHNPQHFGLQEVASIPLDAMVAFKRLCSNNAGSGGISMKTVQLIELTPEELGNARPIVGGKILHRGICYLIVNAKPPKALSTRWRNQTARARYQKWKLLVEKLDEPVN
jgi:hypothetical protein